MIRQVGPDELHLCHALRRTVFIEEQGVSEADEMDDLDGDAVHLLAEAEGRPLGTARLLRQGDLGKIGRVCVAAEARGQGIGAALILASVAHFRKDPAVAKVKLGAQTQALGFYEKLGFEAYGPEYLSAGIAHRDMILPLAR